MTRRYHANNITTTLQAAITAAATSMTVTSATGFPTIGSGEVVRATLSQSGKIEIVEITDDASSPSFTITRAREGTTAQAFSTGATVEIRVTADSIDRKQDQIATAGDVIDFGDATSFEIPNSAAPTVNANGEIALDTTITDHKGLIKYYSGEEMVIPAMPIANLVTTDGYAVVYDAATDAFKMAAGGSVSEAFKTIAVSGQSDIVADGPTDTLTLAAGSNVTITTNAGSDTITFAASVLDSNNNFTADNYITGYATTATAAGTTTLTVDSKQLQYFTGTTTQTVVLPVTSTLAQGFNFVIVNNSTGIVTVQSSGANTVQAMAAGTSATFVCILTSGTSAASWSVMPANVAGVSSNIGTANQITVNGGTTGVSGAVTIALASNATMPGTNGLTLPQGSTGSRPGAGTFGRMRANTSTGYFELDNGSAWRLIPSAPETVTAGCIPVWSGTNNPTLTDSGVAISGGSWVSYATTATAAGTTTLTVSSKKQQYFTGTTTQNCDLPVTSTLVLGHQFEIVNNSTGVVTVRSSGGNTVVAMASLSKLVVTCILTSGTTAASWDYEYTPNGVDMTGSGALVRATSPTLVTPTLGVATATSINFGQDPLNYYDEGTWTPVFTFDTAGDISVSYVTQTGFYTRIGNLVTYRCILSFTPTFTTSSGNMRITGAPFTASANGGMVGSVQNHNGNISYPASYNVIAPSIAASSAVIQLVAFGSAVARTTLTVSNITSGVATTLNVNGYYYV